MKVFTDFTQYSPAWWDAHMGRPSASNFDRIITPAKAKLSAQADSYIAELCAEHLCYTPNFFTERGQVPDQGPVSREVEEGTRREPESRKWYSLERNIDVEEVGGCLSECGRFWSSPDGLIGTREGVLELKNPKASTQAAYLLAGTLPEEYRAQVHGHLVVTGLPFVDFASYHPSMPGLIVRVEPDGFTRELKIALEQFWARYESAAKRFGIDLARLTR